MVRNLTDLLGSVVRRDRDVNDVVPPRDTCLVCSASLLDSTTFNDFRVCHSCSFHYSMTARERVESLVDRDSFSEINRSITSLDPLSFTSRSSYKRRIFRDQRRTGLTEAAVTGTCTISGSPAMLVVLDFGFMGGTMGCVVGEKVALAFEQAAKKKLPIIAIVTSGGDRIQEGILALMQMAKTSISATRFSEKGLPFITVLANPSTGPTYASFANLADIIVAEPGAVVGFSPLRVIKETSDEPLPQGSNTAESHAARGMIDAVTDRTELRRLLSVVLDLFGPQYRLTAMQNAPFQAPDAPRTEAWDSVQLARHESRPTSSDYIRQVLTNFVELHGDRTSGDDPSIICGFGQLGGQTVMAIGQERGQRDEASPQNDGRTLPEGFRKAKRMMTLATRFDLPLITLIDTPGPDLSVESEERGLGNAIAMTMSEMAALNVPSISVVIGEGGNAGALALGVADRALMMENAIYTAVSPEDAAELIYQDQMMAEEVAESLKLTAQDCRDLGIIDLIVAEPMGGAHTDPEEAARQLRRVLLQELTDLQSMPKRRILTRRYKKFRNMGEYSSHFRAAIVREVDSLQSFVATGVRRIARRSSANDSSSEPVLEIGESGLEDNRLN